MHTRLQGEDVTRTRVLARAGAHSLVYRSRDNICNPHETPRTLVLHINRKQASSQPWDLIWVNRVCYTIEGSMLAAT